MRTRESDTPRQDLGALEMEEGDIEAMEGLQLPPVLRGASQTLSGVPASPNLLSFWPVSGEAEQSPGVEERWKSRATRSPVLGRDAWEAEWMMVTGQAPSKGAQQDPVSGQLKEGREQNTTPWAGTKTWPVAEMLCDLGQSHPLSELQLLHLQDRDDYSCP